MLMKQNLYRNDSYTMLIVKYLFSQINTYFIFCSASYFLIQIDFGVKDNEFSVKLYSYQSPNIMEVVMYNIEIFGGTWALLGLIRGLLHKIKQTS